MAPVVPHILRYESLASTNTTLKELSRSGAQAGTVILAKQQTQGRGRTDRSWSSPQGGLYFSLLLKSDQMHRTTDLPLLAGAVLSHTVKRTLPSHLSIGVKWPNDCLLEGRKVGGVLCESTGDGRDAALIIGVGLNVNIPATQLVAFQERPFKATSFLECSPGKVFDLDAILQAFLGIFFQAHEKYMDKGFRFLQNYWEKECLLIGREVELKNTGLNQEKESSTGSNRGRFLGIDEQGALVLSKAEGDRQHFVTGELTCCW